MKSETDKRVTIGTSTSDAPLCPILHGPIHRYNKLVAIRNAKVKAGIRLSYRAE
jgi:hypothetical protein